MIRTRMQGDTPFYPNMLNNGKVEVCLKEDVDKSLAEKDKEIALLKERICNGDVSRATWIDDCFAKDKEIAELKQKLESVQNSMYCDVVDANMENRRLRRALWLARALRARDIQRWWIAATCAPKTERACSVWNNVERKCRAMAEKFK